MSTYNLYCPLVDAKYLTSVEMDFSILACKVLINNFVFCKFAIEVGQFGSNFYNQPNDQLLFNAT